jgi:hypothetical protein
MRAAAACLLPLLLLLLAGCSAPPQKEIDMAQGAIDAARAAGAEQYASDAFRGATTALQEANDAVGQRDFRLALSRALEAHERAQEAARGAADGKARARSDAEVAIVAASTAVQDLRTRLKEAEADKLPRRELQPAIDATAAAENTLQEARAALKAGDYRQARAAVDGVPARIAQQTEALEALAKKPARPGRRNR